MRFWWYFLVASCSSVGGVPGSEIVGTFGFTATPIERRCELSDLPATEFNFQGTISRTPSNGETWLTLRGYPRPANYDGQFMQSNAEAKRTFVSCTECVTRLEESLMVAILSESQSAALSANCPSNIFDGGVPLEDAEKMIFRPGTGPGREALLACGIMTSTVRSDGECVKCDGCQVTYQLTGSRQ